MTPIEIIVIVLASIIVVGVVIAAIVKKIQGKGGCSDCGGDCFHCSYHPKSKKK